MQNSLDRLLGGMAATLADEVAPALEDPYLRSQATAAAELLRTLAPRLTWDLTATTPWARSVDDLARRAIDAGADVPACRALPAADHADAEATQDAYLAALSELARLAVTPGALPADVAADALAAVGEQVGNDKALLKLAR